MTTRFDKITLIFSSSFVIIVLVAMLSDFCPLITAQDASSRYVKPQLAPGEVVEGKEHPEYFSRRMAFHTMLNVLAVRPQDAPRLQQLARNIETRLIGLNDDDAIRLEAIVESFRVAELSIDRQAAFAKLNQNQAVSTLPALYTQRAQLLTQAARDTHLQLSVAGSKSVAAYLKVVISSSKLTNTARSNGDKP